jgi:transglutaminase-like putative cysteine protease
VKIEILYQTQYTYAEPVSFSSHVYRLFPKADSGLVVRRVDFQTNADAVVSFRRDLFDNEIASCFYPNHSALLSVNLRIELEVQEKNAFSFLLASHALEFPFTYEPEEARVLAPYLQDSTVPELPFWKRPASSTPTVEMLVDLNRAMREHLAYERRDHGTARAPAETLALRSGACRDFAVLLAETLRGLGIAARLASGYLNEVAVAERRAEGALHAWTEAYLPGAGWVGFDPTNGVLCNHHHITAAVGLGPADVSPVIGRYFHSRHVPAQMNASLNIHEVS